MVLTTGESHTKYELKMSSGKVQPGFGSAIGPKFIVRKIPMADLQQLFPRYDSPAYLVFGDLHGRVLPAFALTRRFELEFTVAVNGILQVGDLGYFPQVERLDAATRRFAARDPMELGVSELNSENRLACELFSKLDPYLRLYFTAGNHEDFAALEQCRRRHQPAWPVDDFQRLWCLDDGSITPVSPQLRVGSLWGIDGVAPGARRLRHPRMQIDSQAVEWLLSQRFDVLITHESPLNAVLDQSGSYEISLLVDRVQPALAFFGHYHHPGRLHECTFRSTSVYWMQGFEMNYRGGAAEPQSVGVIQRVDKNWTFQYLPSKWLAEFRRENWRHWITI